MEITIYEDGQPIVLTIKEKIRVRDLEKASLLIAKEGGPVTEQISIAANLEAIVEAVDGVPGSYSIERFMDKMDIISLTKVAEAITATFPSVN